MNDTGTPGVGGPQAPAESLNPQRARQRDANAERGRMRSATMVFAMATIVSRVAGLAREIVSTAMFGISAAMSAFTVAYQLPNLIRALVADAALSAAFVPVFTELKEKGETERAWRVAGTMMSLILLTLVPLSLVVGVFAPQIVGLFDVSAPTQALAVDLFRILLPIVVLMALSGVVVGMLHAHDHFAVPALAPIAWNAVILVSLAIAASELVRPDQRIYVYTIGFLVGTVVQFALPLPLLRGRGGRLVLASSWRDPAVRSILLIMLPVTLSLGLINLNLLVNTYFAALLDDFGAGVSSQAGPAVMSRAFLIYMLPQGVFSVAVSTVVFPALARYSARADMAGFRTTFADGLCQIFLLLIPTTMFMAVLAEPIVRLLFERGNFGATDTRLVAAALLGFAVGLVFNGAGLLLIRSFFSLKKPWVPTAVALLNLVVNAVAAYLLYRPYGVFGVALATSIVNVMSFVVMYAMLRRTVGLLETSRNVTAFVLTLLAGGIAAAAAWAMWHGVTDVAGTSLPGQLVAMFAALSVGTVFYIGIVLRLRLVGGNAVARLLRRKRPKGRDDG